MTSNILHNIKKKNTLRRKHQRAPDSLDIKEKFKHQRSVVKKMLRDSRARYINSICSDVGSNSKRFWSLFKLKSKSCNVPQSVSIEIDEDIRTYSETPPKIANLFNKYFTSVFTTDSDISEDLFANNDILSCSSTDSSHMENIVLEPEHVSIILRSLDTNKAHGPDEIPARLLTETAIQIAPSLCKLFNKSLSTGVVPRDWKLANVVPVYKKGDKEFVENYRPISLLPLVSKVLERCVFNNVKEHVFSQIKSYQHGFIPGRNCVTQLIDVFDKIGSQLDSGKQIDVAYLDLSKAFDKLVTNVSFTACEISVLEEVYSSGSNRILKIVDNKLQSSEQHRRLVQ